MGGRRNPPSWRSYGCDVVRHAGHLVHPLNLLTSDKLLHDAMGAVSERTV
jgi:hypothetical protein